MVANLASQNITLQTVAWHLVLFYYDDEQISLGSFLTYKILPLGKPSVRLGDPHQD